jgi:hypothetical protein
VPRRCWGAAPQATGSEVEILGNDALANALGDRSRVQTPSAILPNVQLPSHHRSAPESGDPPHHIREGAPGDRLRHVTCEGAAAVPAMGTDGAQFLLLAVGICEGVSGCSVCRGSWRCASRSHRRAWEYLECSRPGLFPRHSFPVHFAWKIGHSARELRHPQAFRMFASHHQSPAPESGDSSHYI